MLAARTQPAFIRSGLFFENLFFSFPPLPEERGDNFFQEFFKGGEVKNPLPSLWGTARLAEEGA